MCLINTAGRSQFINKLVAIYFSHVFEDYIIEYDGYELIILIN